MSRPADSADVERFCRDRLGWLCTAQRLAGDASTRVYWRLVPREAGADRSSRILMDTGVALDAATDPFLTARALLAGIGLPVPGVVSVLARDGMVVLEDLGDELLQARLAEGFGPATEALYARAVAHLIRLHVDGTAALRRLPEHPAARQALDHDRFLFELNFMLEHFAVGLRKAAFSPPERSILGAFFERLSTEAARAGRVLCHRDYHARNLMVLPGDELAIVDFQDARWGPVTYDIASLLRDSYVALPEPFVERCLEEFRQGLRARLDRSEGDTARAPGLPGSPESPGSSGFIESLDRVLADSARWRQWFDLSCLQRNLKALGTFGYQLVARNNPVYLPYVAPTSAHVRRNLARFPEFATAAEILDRVLPEPTR